MLAAGPLRDNVLVPSPPSVSVITMSAILVLKISDASLGIDETVLASAIVGTEFPWVTATEIV